MQRTQARARRTVGEAGFGYLLLSPQLLGFVVLGVYPLVEVFRLSLYQVNALSGASQFVGLANFTRMLEDPDSARIMLNTFFLVVVLSVMETVLSLALALLLNQRLPGIDIFRAAVFIPALVTMVAWTVVWRFVLQPGGFLDWLGSLLDLAPVDWLRGDFLSLGVIAVVQTLKNIGLYMMMFLAALQSVPSEIVEAARVDGANRWQTFRNVVVPQISPSILMVFMLTIVGAFKVFDVIYILTQGGPGVSTTPLSYAVYSAFAQNDIGYASAYSVVLFLLVLLISCAVWQLRRRFVFYEAE
jgi:multiple sugar transport system permease protein